MLSFNLSFVVVVLAFAFLAESVPVLYERSNEWLQQNGLAAQALNDQYASLTSSSSCIYNGDVACVNNEYAVCHKRQYVTHPCPSGWSCAAIPNDWQEGTITTCNPDDKIEALFRRAGLSEYSPIVTDSKHKRPEQNEPADKGSKGQHPTLVTSWGGADWCRQKSCVNQGKYQILHREARDPSFVSYRVGF